MFNGNRRDFLTREDQVRHQSRPMYGRVVSAPVNRDFVFAKAGEYEIFVHLSNGRKMDGYRRGLPWLSRTEVVSSPEVGDHLFMLVIPGKPNFRNKKPGWKALLWAYDEKPLAFHYTKDPVAGWWEFEEYSRMSGFALNEQEKVYTSTAALIYLHDRIEELTSQVREDERCWHWAMLEVEYVDEVVKRLGLNVNTASRLQELQQAQKTEHPSNPVERMIKRAKAELEAGRASTANEITRDACELELKDSGRIHSPVNEAMYKDPACLAFRSRCAVQIIKQQRTLVDAMLKAYFDGDLSRVSELWVEAHNFDSDFHVAGILDIKDWCDAGLFALLDALMPLLAADERYTGDLKVLREHLPAKAERNERQTQMANTLSQAHDHKALQKALKLYDQYVVKQGLENEFLSGGKDRDNLLRRLRATVSIEEIQYLICGVWMMSDDEKVEVLDEALVLESGLSDEVKKTAGGLKVELQLAHIEFHCNRAQDSMARIFKLAENISASERDVFIIDFYHTIVAALSQKGRHAEVPELVKSVSRAHPEFTGWEEVLAKAIGLLYSLSEIEAAHSLYFEMLREYPHLKNGVY